MKRKLGLVVLLLSFFSVFSQSSSHNEFKYKIEKYTQLAFSYETTECLIISVTSEEDMLSYSVSSKNIDKVDSHLKNAFDAASCSSCKKANEVFVEEPIDYLYSKIPDYKVFLIRRFKDKFSITSYVGEEEFD